MGGQQQASRLRKQLWKQTGSWVALRLSAGRTALGDLGTSAQGGNTLVDVMPVGSGMLRGRAAAFQVGAVGELGVRIAPTGNPILAGVEYGTTLDYLVEGSKPSVM
jgi:hypothetical protein